MGSKSEDINCIETVVLTNTSGFKGFIFDATLEISYDVNIEYEDYWHFWKTVLTTITCQIGSKYQNLGSCSFAIAELLWKEIENLKPPLTKWKGTISVAGQFHFEHLKDEYSKIIYDWFSYDGFMTVPKNSEDQIKPPPVCLQYTIRFLLNPALPIARYIYSAKGYKNYLYYNWTYDDRKKYFDMYKKVDYKKEYNHLEIWRAAYNDYKTSE